MTSASEIVRSANAGEESADGTIEPNDTLVYIGTYTGPASQGIYLFKLPAGAQRAGQSAALFPLGLAAQVKNPSFLDIDPRRRLVFAVTESDQFGNRPTGAVSSFSLDAKTGKLTLINQQSSMGSGPCHLVLDKSGRNVLVANYGSGSVAVLPVEADGRLGEASDVVEHVGSSVNPQRQAGPHAHCVTLDPANRYLFVCDLGLDKVLCYRFDAERGKLEPNDPAFTSLKPGAGPRHMVFRPDGRFAFVVNELDSTVSAFAYDADRGVLDELQTISTLPVDFQGDNTTAEIDVHPSGKYLYASNRGHNSVVAFAIDPQSGALRRISHHSSGGKTPRNFGIEPSGNFLIIANQDSDTLQLCKIDADSGRLQAMGSAVSSPRPVCVKFLLPADRL